VVLVILSELFSCFDSSELKEFFFLDLLMCDSDLKLVILHLHFLQYSCCNRT
jgi:hypothetical protein